VQSGESEPGKKCSELTSEQPAQYEAVRESAWYKRIDKEAQLLTQLVWELVVTERL
jgi:hypothetical protein